MLRLATVFLSHGGANSVSESALFGTPLLLSPMGADQPMNARRVADGGIGRIVGPPSKLTGADLDRELAIVMAEPSYAAAASTCGRIGKFAGGVSRAADLIEHTLDVGTAHLGVLGLKAPGWQYYNLDLLAIAAAALAFVVTVVRVCCYRRRMRRGRAARRKAD